MGLDFGDGNMTWGAEHPHSGRRPRLVLCEGVCLSFGKPVLSSWGVRIQPLGLTGSASTLFLADSK